MAAALLLEECETLLARMEQFVEVIENKVNNG